MKTNFKLPIYGLQAGMEKLFQTKIVLIFFLLFMAFTGVPAGF